VAEILRTGEEKPCCKKSHLTSKHRGNSIWVRCLKEEQTVVFFKLSALPLFLCLCALAPATLDKDTTVPASDKMPGEVLADGCG
jgi:hypothetical protein